LVAEGDYEYRYTSRECFVEAINGIFLSNISFVRNIIENILKKYVKSSVHGPCLSDKDGALDMAFCFHLHSCPRQAEQWIYRHRPGQWPPDILIDNIVNDGCILVPIGPKEIENSELMWRI